MNTRSKAGMVGIFILLGLSIRSPTSVLLKSGSTGG